METIDGNVKTIGGSGKAWIANAELNNYKTTGTYAISTGATADGVSTGLTYFLLTVIAPRTDTVYQILESQNVVLVRECRNNVWSGLFSLLTSKSNYVEYTNVTVDFDSIPLNTVAKVASSSGSHFPVGTSFYGTVETVCGNPTATNANRYAIQKAYRVEGTGVINTYMRAYFNSEWHSWNGPIKYNS